MISGVSAIYLLEPFAGAQDVVRDVPGPDRKSTRSKAKSVGTRAQGRRGRNLNSHLRNYAFSRTELVDKGRIISRYPLLPSFRIGAYTFGPARERHPEPALAVGHGRRPYLLHEALNSGLVLPEKSTVVPGFSEGSPGFEPSRALAHVA